MISERSEPSAQVSYWQKIGLSVRDGYKMHRESGQLAKGPDNWRNVTQHCLVQVARTETLGKWLGLSGDLIAEMKMGAILHDFSKRQEIIATRQAILAGNSPLAAVKSEQQTNEDILRSAGFSSKVRRLAGSTGGLVAQLTEVQRILDQETLSDDDLAYLIVHYVDDCSTGTGWIIPSQLDPNGRRVNIIDFRMQQNKAKADYNIISVEVTEELFSHPLLGGMNNLDASAFVSHGIERRLAQRISEITGEIVDPLTIPELVDQKIREAIENRVNMNHEQSQPSESNSYGLNQTYEQYAKHIDSWLQARQDRDAYLLAVNSSDQRLRRVDQFTTQLVQMLPPNAMVADLGFGPEGRDMADIIELGSSKGVSVTGVELVRESIVSALRNPRFNIGGRNIMEGKVMQADITLGIPVSTSSVDAVILSSVVQHIEPPTFYTEVAPEIVRILKPNGILQIIFKRKEGVSDILTVQDVTLGGVERSFYVYKPDEIVQRFQELGMELYRGDDKMVGGILLWDDQNRPIPYAGMYLIKFPH